MTEVRQFRQHRFVPPPGSCEILLVRHGESSPHVEGEPFTLVDGHGDPELAPEGREQAALVADRLISTDEKISAIYVTTLRRTHETAAPLAERLGIEPQVEPDRGRSSSASGKAVSCAAASPTRIRWRRRCSRPVDGM